MRLIAGLLDMLVSQRWKIPVWVHSHSRGLSRQVLTAERMLALSLMLKALEPPGIVFAELVPGYLKRWPELVLKPRPGLWDSCLMMAMR